ncbi:LysR family transcriptional regulator [Chondromyces apiculatus]|uniref:Transcriptional regulator, LysR family n=1 Tax=Chondromyces apiculatus DSM 436 TaxID=1192034 RepID=A0A017T4I4_9BACT|nr:LysR family transcriptional regulator [Chondromyces apiculatus]EYF03725.1 transcriptional regulator, LysR family [Chondromyces apiculatus DSM 436]
MDLNRIAIFVRVVEDRSFTAAARALGLPKSSVSRAVSLLEEDLRVRLLHRSARAVSLTEAGSIFYERVSRGLTAVTEAAAAVTDMEGAVCGPIRITAPVDVGVWMLAPAITRFVRRHPSVHVDVILTGRIVDLVEEGFDLAVRAGLLRDSALIARRIGNIASALYASPRYLARAGTPATVADLSRHQCILFRATRGRVIWTFTGPTGEERMELGGQISADDFSFVRRTILSGAGIGLVPPFMCRREIERGKLVRVLPEHSVPGAPLHLVYPTTRHIPHRVAVFRDHLLDHLNRYLDPAPKPPSAMALP